VATLREVAKLASVSTATVSKVLSNTPYVSAETRARVLRAIEALNYVPNLAARALSHGRTYNIGVIFPYHYDHIFADPHMLHVLEGVETVCTRESYNIILSTPRAPMRESVQYQRLMQSGYLDGVIALRTLPDDSSFDEYGYPSVCIGGSGMISLQIDNFVGAKALAAYLLALGHRAIGIIGVDPAVLIAAEQRMAGYRAAFEDLGLRFEDVPVAQGRFSIESGYQAAKELLALAPRTTAIMCLNDRMAMGAIQYAWETGLNVPADLSVAGYDDIPGAAYFAPPLTTVRQPAREIGARAAELLFELIEEQAASKHKLEAHPEPIVFETELIIRGSAAHPRKGGDA